jgi:hypothetical protein
MANVEHGDLAVFSIGGASQIDYLPDVDLTFDPTMDDASAILSGGERNEVTKKGATIAATLLSDATGASRVSNIDLSALLIGGTDYISYVRGGNFRLTIPNTESGSVKDLWKTPQPLPNRRQVAVTVKLQVPAASATANALRAIGAINVGNREANQVAFSMTLGGVTITLAMTIASVSNPQRVGEMFEMDINLVGRAPVSGTFITSPAGTTTLLEKAINDSKTVLAFVFTPHNDVGFGYSYNGNMVVESVEFGWEDEQIVRTAYTYRTAGAVSGANT